MMAAGKRLSMTQFPDRDVEWSYSVALESPAGVKHVITGTLTNLAPVSLFLTFNCGGDSSS
jgi:hypothetical protein